MLSFPEEMGRVEADRGVDFRAAAAPAHSWETELIIICGTSREELPGRIRALQDFLHRNPEVSLKDLAYTLNADLSIDGSRLALVAGSVSELNARLARAAQRIADPNRRQIKDTAGIYYFDQPLHPEGGLALLFPGEGAQYLNMLADLCPHFPEVKQCFDEADRAAQQASWDGLSRVFLAPEHSPAEQRTEAESALRQLDNAMLSILLADWAMFQLLLQLGLKPSAMAGHSMGEIAALWAAGCLDIREIGREQTVAALNVLVSKETAGELASADLLAVGAGRDTLEKIIQETAGSSVLVAMDNCPHQSVVVGSPKLMGLLEKQLRTRRILCERLPFNRPYHTSMFEPYLGPLHKFFDTVAFHPAKVPVYSCSTGHPFPSEPADIRKQVVLNLAARVEFSRLIQNMHDDGVRLFVESGPRNNLTSFVEDILRGKRFAAVASNLPRCSGLTQLNHLAGQLAAHRVPLKFEHLYSRRDPRRVSWEPVSASVVHEARANGNDAAPGEGLPISEIDNSSVTIALAAAFATNAQYLRVMEQFHVDQREVMEAYFARQSGSGDLIDDLGRPVSGGGSVGGAELPTDDSLIAGQPLLSTAAIVRCDPGKEVVVHRRLDLVEDLFAPHHAVGGQAVSKVDPNQHGLPVVPMTFSLEIMAEAAALIAPGLVVIGVKDIRLFRWLAFDEEEPSTIEISARMLSAPAPEPEVMAQVSVQIRDLGRSPSVAGSRDPAAQGVVLLAEQFPQPPPVGKFRLTNEHPSRISVEVLYKNLFHGPLLQGVQPGGRTGEEGTEREVVVLPRHGLLRSDPDPSFLIDPVLLDMSMHPLTGWHLEFPDQSGRIMLPIEVEKLEVFGRSPEVGARFISRASTVATSYRHFIHSVDMVGPDGNMWSRLHRVKFWRFYVPFSKVNFHGPKDEYFISEEISLQAASVSAHCVRLDVPADQRQEGMRLVTAKVTLSPSEWPEFRALQGSEQEQTEWLFGRLAMKDTVRLLWHARHGVRLFPADIVIKASSDGRPVAMPRSQAGLGPFPTISLAHAKDVVIGLAAFAPYAGIGVEYVHPCDSSAEDFAFNDKERALLDRFGANRAEWIARFGCAKKAVADALDYRSTDAVSAAAICSVDERTGTVKIILGPTLAELFPHWQFASLLAYTVRDADLVVGVSFCEKAAQ